MSTSASKGHPKGLYILFATEMWERFNYYGMRAILILFMTKALLFNKEFASLLYGSYTSLVYLTPLVGGFMADRFWGNQRSIIAGGLVMALGEFVLFFCGSYQAADPALANILFFSGLGFMIAGNGFFKPNISSLVGQLYPKNDRRTDSAYTIFYMGINTGGALGPFICGLVGETGNVADFKWAFLAGGIGMLISVIIQAIYHKKYVVDPQQKVLGLTPDNAPGWAKSTLNTAFILLGFSAVTIALIYIDAKVYSYLFYLLIGSIVLIAGIIFTDKTLNSIEKSKVAVIFVVSFFVVFFWSAFEQAGASLTFFADEQTQRVVNFKFPVWLVVSLCAALLAYVVKLFKSVSVGLGSAYDAVLRYPVYALLGLLALGDLYVIKTVLMSGGSSIELVEVPASWFQSLNSMFVVGFAPFFAWLWLKLGKYDPSSPTKMALGLFMLALGYLWIAFGVKDVQPGIKVSMIWLIGMYALHTCGELSLSPIGLSLVNKLAPIKYASLLMAVWFTANAFANKLAGVLSALYPEEGKTRELLGYAISNNYDFFLLFVAMAGAASIILFFLSRKLQGLMKD